jgi:5-methyltetrahydrofolate--homocysteine methyltransferase
MTIHIRFRDEDWQRISRDWNAWWAGELERPLVSLEIIDPVPGADFSQFSKWGLDTPIDAIIDNWQRIFEATHWLGDAFPKWWVNFGPGTTAAFLGSPVSWSPDTTWFWPLEGVNTLADIHPAYDPANRWWQRVKVMTARAMERWGHDVLVGMTDLGGTLDVLASLRGSEKLLLDLTDEPDEVERLMREITPLWLRYYDELEAITRTAGRGNACWGPCWSPGPGYMLQCDFSYMISPRMFQRFVMPDLVACCDHLDYGFYHLDGKGEIPHLDQLLSIQRLRGVQWQPGDGQPLADGWLPLLKRIRDAGKLCQVYVTCAGALKIVRELGGKGFIFEIINETLTVDEGAAFVRELHKA